MMRLTEEKGDSVPPEDSDMNFKKEEMRLYAVTDRRWNGSNSMMEQLEKALRGGVTLVQLREKDLSYDEFLEEAIEAVKLCHAYGVKLLINDNVDIAIKSGADGVHVGQSDMPAADVRRLAGEDFIIGTSARTVEAALEAQRQGADYLGVGACFGTSTKDDARAIDLQVLRDITEAVDIPVVGIGGITEENIPKLKGSGISGVALVSAIFAAEDIESRCRDLLKLISAL